MFDEIIKKMIIILHSNQKIFIYPKINKNSNLEEKPYLYEGIL